MVSVAKIQQNLHLLSLRVSREYAKIRPRAKRDKYRRLAQLVRALGRHPRGHQFESGTAYQIHYLMEPVCQ